jgi:hypothetical protein
MQTITIDACLEIFSKLITGFEMLDNVQKATVINTWRSAQTPISVPILNLTEGCFNIGRSTHFFDFEPNQFPLCIKATILSYLCGYKPMTLSVYHILENKSVPIIYGYSDSLFEQFSPQMQKYVAGIFLKSHSCGIKIPMVHQLCRDFYWSCPSIQKLDEEIIYDDNEELVIPKTHKLCTTRRYSEDCDMYQLVESVDNTRVIGQSCPDEIRPFIPEEIKAFVRRYNFPFELVGDRHLTTNTGEWKLRVAGTLVDIRLLDNDLSDFFNKKQFHALPITGKSLKAPRYIVKANFPMRTRAYWTGRLKFDRVWHHEFSSYDETDWVKEVDMRGGFNMMNFKPTHCSSRVRHPLGEIVTPQDIFQL